jgi:heat shock protein HtpX
MCRIIKGVFMQRIFLFLLTNVLVMTSVMIVANLLGLESYITPYGINYQSLAVMSLLWGFMGAFISLFMSKWMAKKMMGVKLVEQDRAYTALVHTVHQYARAAGIYKMPEVGVYDSPEINAFATGRSKNNSLVAVSSGLLQSMKQDEIEGVLAHEVAHIANGDMVTMTLVQGVVNSFVIFFSRIIGFAVANFMSGDDDEGPSQIGYFVSSIVAQIVFSILGSFVVAYVSRKREFKADAGGAALAGRDKMINALKRLKGSVDIIDRANPEIASMKISSRSGLFALMSTHPDLDDRIAALQKV